MNVVADSRELRATSVSVVHAVAGHAKKFVRSDARRFGQEQGGAGRAQDLRAPVRDGLHRVGHAHGRLGALSQGGVAGQVAQGGN